MIQSVRRTLNGSSRATPHSGTEQTRTHERLHETQRIRNRSVSLPCPLLTYINHHGFAITANFGSSVLCTFPSDPILPRNGLAKRRHESTAAALCPQPRPDVIGTWNTESCKIIRMFESKSENVAHKMVHLVATIDTIHSSRKTRTLSGTMGWLLNWL